MQNPISAATARAAAHACSIYRTPTVSDQDSDVIFGHWSGHGAGIAAILVNVGNSFKYQHLLVKYDARTEVVMETLPKCRQ
jgi:hypothetical protein